MAIVFEISDRVIKIESPAVSVTGQALINAIRNFEDDPYGEVQPQVADASGKDVLGGGTYVGITIRLINNWRVQFEARPGPDWVQCKVTGCNLTAVNDYDDEPLKPSAYVFAYIAQSTSPALVEGSGGATPAEIWAYSPRTLTSFGTLVNDIATAVWAATTRTLTSIGSIVADIWAYATRTLTAGTKDAEIDAIKAKTDTMNWNDILLIKSISSGRWKIDSILKQLIFFDEGDVELMRFDLLDRDGAPTNFGAAVQVGEVMERRPL